jgi:hypothetical protein
MNALPAAEAAERQANTLQTNDPAKEHLVVRLPQPKRGI